MVDSIIAPQAAAFITLWQNSSFPWQGTALICVFISVAFAAIAYMLAAAFKSDEVRKWAKGELFYAFTNVFLIAFILLFMATIGTKMLQFSDELARTATPEMYASIQGQDPIVLPLYYVDKVTECLRISYIRNYCFNSVLEAVYDIDYKKVGNPIVQKPSTLSNTVGAGIINSAHILSTLLTGLLQIFYVQEHLLYFFNGTMLTVFLPLGIILRTFAPTRGAGNLFIGIAIGFGIVFPLSYGMVLAIQGPQIEQSATHKCGITTATPSPSAGVFTCSAMMAGSLTASSILLPFKLMPKLPTTATVAGYTAFAAVSSPLIWNYYNQTMSMAQDILQYAVLYPIIVLGITLTFTRSFTMFLGGDAQDFMKGLSRLI
jgi:hypothetical protein